ncbi:hypothetical protein MASR2M15_27480 [Anaerolineales bacterium]
MMERFKMVEDWTERNLENLPDTETDEYEYKSSRIREVGNYRSELQQKIWKTAAAFWNTGGGILIIGVDDKGTVDGGIPAAMGGQKLRDWVDQTLASITPPGDYVVKTIMPEYSDSKIDEGHVVLVVGFSESRKLPHMGPDGRYYIRAGAHSIPANHYMVESMLARRGQQRPTLRGLLRANKRKIDIVELVVVNVNDVPALDVEISFTRLDKILHPTLEEQFPIFVPLIDKRNIFRMHIKLENDLAEWFNDPEVYLELTYHDAGGESFSEQQAISYHTNGTNINPMSGENGDSDFLQKIYEEIHLLRQVLEKIIESQGNSSK